MPITADQAYSTLKEIEKLFPTALGEVRANVGEISTRKRTGGYRTVLTYPPRRDVKYIISVKTGDIPLAGTTAKVYIYIFGTNGSIANYNLPNKDESDNKTFQSGQTDQFIIRKWPDLGDIVRVMIRHDTSGSSFPGWFLDSIEITSERNDASNEKWVFPCKKWLARGTNRTLERDPPYSGNRVYRITVPDAINVILGFAHGRLEGGIMPSKPNSVIVSELYKEGQLIWKRAENPSINGLTEEEQAKEGLIIPWTYDSSSSYANIGIADEAKGWIAGWGIDEHGDAPGDLRTFQVRIKRDPNATGGSGNTVGGIGAYIIPILPYAVVYAPPQGVNRANRVIYEAEATVGTTYRTTSSVEESTKRPVSPEASAGLGDFGDAIKEIGKMPVIKEYAESITGFIAGAYGSGNASETTGNGTIWDVASTFEQREGLKREIDGQPGVDDMIYFFRDVYVGWHADVDKLRKTFLGYKQFMGFRVRDLQADLAYKEYQESIAESTRTTEKKPPRLAHAELSGRVARVTDLREGLIVSEIRRIEMRRQPPPLPEVNTGLSPSVIRALLALDPFVDGGEQVALEEPRFVPATFWGSKEIGVVEGPDDRWWGATLSVEDANGEVTFATRIEDYSSTWLGRFWGFGPQETKTITTNAKCTNYRKDYSGKSLKTTLHLDMKYPEDTGPNREYVVINGYYDRAFGTIAFQKSFNQMEPCSNL